ncbi:ribosome maturation factor RimP [Jiangella aurantiaca]|uniref:Ribosome maturation factor RimP n=1 Tax=Jiangella aurantiaca TaxID=2530373 RepID=A0A4R5A7G8_9ACTN|nr:ribosome maturation factor RimP [Jiangella aurantiaca]TDD67941.1 ribosome maturation factor RimP [Jiangella aurantiaca]
MTSATRDLLEQVIEPVVASEGLDLESLELSQAGRRSRLRIIVDADGGVDLDRCAEVSRHISKALDDSGAMGDHPYTLEVSSPGVSRPLTLPRHWSRATGRLVRAILHDGGDVTGRVVSADDDSAVLDVDGASRVLAYADVRKAKVQVEFRKTDDTDLDDFEEED